MLLLGRTLHVQGGQSRHWDRMGQVALHRRKVLEGGEWIDGFPVDSFIVVECVVVVVCGIDSGRGGGGAAGVTTAVLFTCWPPVEVLSRI